MGDELKPLSFIHTSLERTHSNIQRFEQNSELLKADLYKFALIPWSPGFQAVCEITRDPLLHPAYCRCDATVFDISSSAINGDGIPLQKLSKVPNCEINAANIKLIDQPIKSVDNAKVTVVFDSCENSSDWQGNIEAFADVLSSVLTLNLFYVTQHCLVDLEGFDLCGIKYIIFHCNKLNGACGRIRRSTKITIKSLTDFPSYLRLTTNLKLELAPGLGSSFEKLNGLVQDFVKGKHKLKLNKVFVNGPSGCGKSVLVEQVCQRNNLHVVLISGGTCADSKPGEAERKLREAFSTAHQCAPKGIVVIDQIDSLSPKIRDSTPSHTRRLVKQLATLLDQAKSVLVVGLSSRPNEVDPSILRAGRLEISLVIAPPTEGERKLMLGSLFKPFAQDIDQMQELCSVAARLTPGYILADLSLLVRETALEAHRGEEKNWMKSMYSMLAKMKPATMRGGLGVVTTDPMSMDQIGGLTGIKLKLKTVIEWPLLYPSAFHRMGIPRPKGVLLYGPPGCAKTSLVKAIASMIGTSFLAVSAAELYSSLVGESEKSLTALFQRARSAAPAVLFIDEIDALVGQRGDSQVQTGVQERVLATVLVEMDGLTVPVSGGGVLVVAATNRPDLVDAALLRPGRFDQMIHVPAPDLDSRVSILQTITSTMSVGDDLDLNEIGAKTELFSGADLQQLCKEAALWALTVDGMQVVEVKKCHFSKVLQTMKPSLSQKQLDWYKVYRTGQGHGQ